MSYVWTGRGRALAIAGAPRRSAGGIIPPVCFLGCCEAGVIALLLPIAFTSGAIAVVWLTLLIRFLGLYGASMALIIVASCFGYEFYHVKVGPLPLTADRLMLGGLFALYVVQLRHRIIQSKRLDVADILFGIFFVGTDGQHYAARLALAGRSAVSQFAVYLFVSGNFVLVGP